MIRRGDSVYDDDGKLVAVWTRGAWYRPTSEKNLPVLDHIEPAMSEQSKILFDACENAKPPGPKPRNRIECRIAELDPILELSPRGRIKSAMKLFQVTVAHAAVGRDSVFGPRFLDAPSWISPVGTYKVRATDVFTARVEGRLIYRRDFHETIADAVLWAHAEEWP